MLKTLVLSDTHLTARFDEDKYLFLKKIITPADRIILNGDIWDSYLTGFGRFINSEWQRLFPLLKKKETVYIFGNHDREKKVNKNILGQFIQKAANSFETKIGDRKYVFIHGHQVIKNPDIYFPWLGNPTLITLTQVYTRVMISLFGTKYWQHRRRWNHKIAAFQEKNYPDRVLVSGHTHLAEAITPNYYNCGAIGHRYGQYLTIDQRGIRLEFARY